MAQEHGANIIPENVRQFITDHITSIEQLEVLLFLHARTDTSRSAEEIAKELYIHPESSASRLVDLEQRGLVARDQATPASYRYSPASSALDQCVSLLVHVYKNHRVTIINMIFSKPIDRVRSFADAFKLKKEE